MSQEPTATPAAASRADRVAAVIRAGILDGDLAPGQRLVEEELAAQTGVPRGVVRTALATLDHEGIVERIAHRGARVRVVSTAEAIAITEARASLEVLCAGRAADRVTPELADELRELGAAMTSAVESADVAAYSALNQRLHQRLVEIADQPVAAEIIGMLRARNVRHQFRLAFRPGRPQESLPQHLAIIEAVSTGNRTAAAAAMRTHLDSVQAAIGEPGPGNGVR